MAYRKPHTMDEFAKICIKGDTKLRQTVGTDLVAYLADDDNPIECEDIGAFIDALVQWTQGSNYKVAQNALEALTYICDRLKHDFWPYVSPVLPHAIDRLGDQKDCVRERAQLFILKLLQERVLQPQQLCDKLIECFTHKNAKVREEVLLCFINILNEHGPTNIQVNKLTPGISKLLSDPIPAVRDTALNTFVEIYKHVGDRLSQDLQKKNIIPPTKLKILLQRFQEIKDTDQLLPTAFVAGGHDYGNASDDVDHAIPKPSKPVKRTISAPSTHRLAAGGSGNNVLNSANTMNQLTSTTGSSSREAGAIDEDSFLNSMEDVPTIAVISAKDVNEKALKDLGAIIGDKNMQWTKRIEGLKRIRSLLMCGAASYEDFHLYLRSLGPPLSLAATDGRSQVVRESCVTIAYMAKQLGNKYEKVASVLLPNLINLIQNSAKVIATAGQLCLKQIFLYSQCPSFIPIVASHARESKSREIRRACCDFIGQMIRQWSPTTALRKQISTISDTIKDGIADADNEARLISRKSFWSFNEVYPEAANILLKNLEPTYKRILLSTPGAGDHMSSSSSSSSLNQIPTHQSSATSTHGSGGYHLSSRSGTTSGARPKKTTTTKNAAVPSSATKERSGRTRSRPLGGSISQPTSRSVSPSLRNNYLSHGGRFLPQENDTSTPSRPRKLSSSRIPRSTSVSRDHSRETSPTRGSLSSRHMGGYSSLSFRGSSGPGSLRCTPNRDHRPPISPHRPPVMAQKILQQSREAETALAAALQTDPSLEYDFLKSYSGRKLNRSLDNPSDDSEASSVCSERSYDSYRRPSDVSMKLSPNLTDIFNLIKKKRQASRCNNLDLIKNKLSPTGQTECTYFNNNDLKCTSIGKKYPSAEWTHTNFNMSGRKNEFVIKRKIDGGSFFGNSYVRRQSASENELSFLDNSYSLSGSRTRLTRDHWDPIQKDINEIIKLCASATWTERKEGLIGLCQYFSDGKILTSSQLKKVTEIFPKMFMDQNTKVVSLFLDTLNELLLAHHNELHDWLYMLLQRIFNKLGSELLQSIYKKIERTLDVIRENYPIDLQMNSIFRYLTDHTQRPNSKVKITILVYIIRLCDISNSIIFDNKTLISQGIDKIITYTEDKKSFEVQNVARNCLIALLNCNTAQFMMLLSTLSRDQQDIAGNIIQSLRNKSTTSGSSSPIKSPTLIQRGSDMDLSTGRIRSGSTGGFTTREDIHRSLRNTTAEIQNYSFDSADVSHIERCNTQDSGISQMSTGGGQTRNNNGHIHGGNSNSTTGTLCSPIDDITDGIRDVSLYSNETITNTNGGPMSLPATTTSATGSSDMIVTINGSSNVEEEQFVKKIVSGEISEDKLVEAFNHLTAIIKSGPPACIVDNVTFRMLLKTLLHYLSQKDKEQIQCAVLEVLAEIFKSDQLQPNYLGYVELITLRILKVHDTSNIEVIRHAEQTAAAMTKFPLSTVVQVINPVITTSENCPSIIEGCLKMLTKMVEANGATQLNNELLNLIVPNVIKAYDHNESPVRKCAVFCLVVIHRAAGEEVMKPHLSKLNCVKLKLLDLYIQRAKSNSSVPTSPKNNNNTTKTSPPSATTTTTSSTTSTIVTSS